MKPILKFTFLILAIAVLTQVSCKKEKPVSSVVTPPPPQQKKVKARIVELGTNLPIVGATLQVCTSPNQSPITNSNPKCAMNYLQLTTNANGECFFEADKYRFDGVSKDGYWGYSHEPYFNTYFGDDSLLYTDGIHTADSFIVRKIPETYITIHVKNSITILDRNVELFRLGLSYNQWGFYPGGGVILRPNIDTTFQYLVFGNADNLFAVADNFDGGAFENPLFQQLVYIANLNNFTLNINY